MAATYRHLADRIREFSNVYIAELPECGFHFSKKTVWKPNEYAHWLKDYLDKNNIKKAVFLGHSNSGGIAILMASLFPERVQGLVVADTIGIRRQYLGKVLVQRMLDAVLELRFSIQASPHLIFNLLFHFKNFFSQVFQSGSSFLLRHLYKLKIPTLIVWGQKDHTMPLQLVQQMTSSIRNASVYVSPTGSHDWILTNPDEFVSALREWIEKKMF